MRTIYVALLALAFVPSASATPPPEINLAALVEDAPPPPPCPSDMVTTGVGTCIDRFEYPNKIGSKPRLGLSAIPEARDVIARETHDVVALCDRAGKRPCRLREWRSACRGTPAPAPKAYRACDEPRVARRDPDEMRRLDDTNAAGLASGPSLAGAYDMLGNAEEWVRCGAAPDGWCQVGGHWSKPRDCNDVTRGHSGKWHYFQTGARCCIDQGLDPAPRRRGSLERVTLILASAEVPQVVDETPRHAVARGLRDGIRDLVAIYRTVGAAGELVSPEVDGALLAAVGYFESRNQPVVRAGDKGASLGPMQVAKSMPGVLRVWFPGYPKISRTDLLDPATNVAAAYAILKHWKETCTVVDGTAGEVVVASRPGVWLTAYRRGRCPGKLHRARRSVGPGGERRCAVLTAMLERLDRVPVAWSCGHEGERLSKATRRLVSTLRVR